MNAFTWVLVVLFGGAGVIWAADVLRLRGRPEQRRISVPPSLLTGARLHRAYGGVDTRPLIQEMRRADRRHP
ncbi:hypothetical protein ACFYSC_17810 [Streptosporangium sp. NPDC004379]|uniref:hypothetical protein n=1 Tax=Streptosporangium sp. NPDC004379 TaxID=3366189 RepID=UPI00368D5846